MTDPGSDAILARLLRLHPRLIDLSLDRIVALLGRLDHPQAHLPPVVHVAGTNGKGSTIAFLGAMLEAAGRRVHAYTSPHLVRFHERIRLAGRLIDEPALAALLAECEAANAGAPITFFEITTAAAFLAFARTPADVLLLETGLGGRLDATNVIDRPALTVITPVSIDHTEFLGASLGAIAFEKAGILKPGVGAVIAPQAPEAADVIEARAAAIGTPLSRHGAEWSYAATEHGFVYRRAEGARDFPAPALPGPCQVENAAVAIACLDRLSALRAGRRAIEDGLRTAAWPGRLQRLRRGPLVERLPREDGWEIWLDGGHNPGAAAMLARMAAGWTDRPLHLVLGLLETKDADGFVATLAAYAASARTVPITSSDAGRSPISLAATGRAAGLDAGPAAGPAEAVAEIVSMSKKPARILICGSLYLVGEVLSTNA